MKVCGYTLFLIFWINSISSAEIIFLKMGTAPATSVEQTTDSSALHRNDLAPFLFQQMNYKRLQPRLPKNHPH